MLGGKLYGSDIEQSSFYTAAYMKINALHNFSDFDGVSNIPPCTHMYRQYYTACHINAAQSTQLWNLNNQNIKYVVKLTSF